MAFFFVEDGEALTPKVLSSPQGLNERPLLIHVLGFLRATDSVSYARELEQLGIAAFFENEELRKHLRLLLQGWFGALREPLDADWRNARRLIQNDEHLLGF